mgnify:CR=1 FL=1
MAPSEGKRLLCLGKQLNYVWSVLELDKKKKLRSKKIAGIRGWIQAAATLLTNLHIPNDENAREYVVENGMEVLHIKNCFAAIIDANGVCSISSKLN